MRDNFLRYQDYIIKFTLTNLCKALNTNMQHIVFEKNFKIYLIHNIYHS